MRVSERERKRVSAVEDKREKKVERGRREGWRKKERRERETERGKETERQRQTYVHVTYNYALYMAYGTGIYG